MKIRTSFIAYLVTLITISHVSLYYLAVVLKKQQPEYAETYIGISILWGLALFVVTVWCLNQYESLHLASKRPWFWILVIISGPMGWFMNCLTFAFIEAEQMRNKN